MHTAMCCSNKFAGASRTSAGNRASCGEGVGCSGGVLLQAVGHSAPNTFMRGTLVDSTLLVTGREAQVISISCKQWQVKNAQNSRAHEDRCDTTSLSPEAVTPFYSEPCPLASLESDFTELIVPVHCVQIHISMSEDGRHLLITLTPYLPMHTTDKDRDIPINLPKSAGH